MNLSTPLRVSHYLYAGIDTKASIGDELVGLSVCRLYAGVYRTRTGFDLSIGVLNAQGCLD